MIFNKNVPNDFFELNNNNNNNNNNNRIIIQGREIEILRERRREGDGIERKGELEEKGEREKRKRCQARGFR